MEITKDILYVGVNDHLVDLFESQYDVPNVTEDGERKQERIHLAFETSSSCI